MSARRLPLEFLLLVLLQGFFIFGVLSETQKVRSQNAFYHLRLATHQFQGESVDSLGVLPNSILKGHFVDQHRLFHLVLGALGKVLDPQDALTLLSFLGLGLVMSLIWLFLRDTHPILRWGLPLLLPWLIKAYWFRWLAERPGILGSGLFLLFLFCLQRRWHRVWFHALVLYVITMLWSGFSFIAWIVLPITALLIFFPVACGLPRKQTAILTGAVFFGLFSGGLYACGTALFWYPWLQIQAHVFASSGIPEWQAPSAGSFEFLFPLTLILFSIASTTYRAETLVRELIRTQFWTIALQLLALVAAVLAISQARWIEFALPLALICFGRSVAIDFVRLRLWRWGFALVCLAIFGIRFYDFRHSPKNDGSFDERTLPFLSEVQRRLNFAPVLTLDWTAWSADFYLNPKTRMEPGLSLSIYRDHAEFFRPYDRLRNGRNDDAHADLSFLLQKIGGTHVMLREYQFDAIGEVPWLKRVYTAWPWVLAEVKTAFVPLAEQLNSELAGIDSILPLCSRNPVMMRIELWSTDAEWIGSKSDISIRSETECQEELQKLRKITPPLNQVHVVRLWLKAGPIDDLSQIRTEDSRGFFDVYDTNQMKVIDSNSLSPESKLSPSTIAVHKMIAQLDKGNFQLRGRFVNYQQPSATQICKAYQHSVHKVIERQNQIFQQWRLSAGPADSLRAMLALHAACIRPRLAAIRDKAPMIDMCLRFKAELEQQATRTQKQAQQERNIIPAQWQHVSEMLLVDILAYQHGLKRPLEKFNPEDFIFRNRTWSYLVPGPQGLRPERQVLYEVFNSGHLALWWTTRWQDWRDHGIIPGGEEHDAFEKFARRYEKIWRADFDYSLFAVRWWTEALVNDFEKSSTVHSGYWVEQFFRVTESMVHGPTRESFPGCPGPYAAGIAAMKYPNSTAGLLMEGLEQARRVDFPWWSEKEEVLILNLLRCTLALQKHPAYWPANEAGEFAETTGDGNYRVDTQAHLINALGWRIENDKIDCQP